MLGQKRSPESKGIVSKMVRELLFSITKKDFKIEWFSGRGAGGQHRNKHQNCCRLTHLESGVTTTGQSHRNREANLREAFRSLIKNPKFKMWFSSKTHEVLSGQTIDDVVRDWMRPENIRVEVFRNGHWEEDTGPVNQ